MIIALLIDWNNDGDYLDAGEDVTSRLLSLSFERGKDQARIVSPPMAGQLSASLNNLSRDYSLENTGSPLVGKLEPGRRVRVNVGGGTAIATEGGVVITTEGGTPIVTESSALKTLWTGFLDDIGQDPALGKQWVTVPSLGPLSWIRGKTVSTTLYQNIRTNFAIGYLLDAIGWPSGDRLLASGDTVMDWWWVDEQDAFDALMDILYTEGAGAAIYEDELGRIVFENRNYRMTQTRCVSSQATYTASESLTDFAYSPDFKDVFNACKVEINSRAIQGEQKIWEAGERVTLAASEVRDFIIRVSDPFKDAIIPSPAPSNASQILTPSATLTGGTFKLRFRGATTTSLNYNASAATIQTALEVLSTIGTGNVSCSDGPINTSPVTVAFFAGLGGIAIDDLIEVVESSLNLVSVPATIEGSRYRESDGHFFIEQQMLAPSGTLTGGTWAVTFMQDGSPIYGGTGLAYNITAAALNTACSLPAGSAYGGPINTNPIIVRLPVGTGYENPVATSTGLTMNAPSAFIEVTQGSQGGVPDYIVVSGGLASRTLSRTSGQSTTLTLTATSAGAVIDGLGLRAKPLAVVKSETVENDVTTDITASQTKWGKKPFSASIRQEINQATAKALANGYADFYKRPRASTIIKLSNALLSEDALFARQISDRITVVEPHTGVNHDFYIEKISHLFDTVDILQTEFACERAHGDAHTDTHSDAAHSDAAHTDSHSDTAHTDTHTDAHLDAAHSDGGHTDTHTDTAHVDSHTDAGHGDIAHSDSHADGAHADSHADVLHTDFAHGDDHTDTAHSDVAHADAAHGDAGHADSHTDVAHSDDYGDFQDGPFHTDDHMDSHSDTHTDTAHADSAHGDSAHGDAAHGDTAHADSAHGDAHTDDHTDDAHSDFHIDTHTDSAHSDSHTDTAHGDAHSDAAHSDVAHVDTHSDVAHSDVAHSDAHLDAAHGDAAHTDGHTDTHSDGP